MIVNVIVVLFMKMTCSVNLLIKNNMRDPVCNNCAC